MDLIKVASCFLEPPCRAAHAEAGDGARHDDDLEEGPDDLLVCEAFGRLLGAGVKGPGDYGNSDVRGGAEGPEVRVETAGPGPTQSDEGGAGAGLRD